MGMARYVWRSVKQREQLAAGMVPEFSGPSAGLRSKAAGWFNRIFLFGPSSLALNSPLPCCVLQRQPLGCTLGLPYLLAFALG